MKTNHSLFEELKCLEESLWISSTRFDQAYMENVFALDFFEFGRSGRRYSREQCLKATPGEIKSKIPLEQFSIHEIDSNNVLVTYVSEVRNDIVERANRSSLWSRTSNGWRLRFHQGTPI